MDKNFDSLRSGLRTPPPDDEVLARMDKALDNNTGDHTENDLDFDEIIPGKLFLTSLSAARKRDLLVKNGITHILTMGLGMPALYTQEFSYQICDVEDYCSVLIYNKFKECFCFIDDALLQGGKVLVHCEGGVSRSATICIGYLMHANGMAFEEAFNLVKAARPVISPNPGFRAQLETFEKLGFELDAENAQVQAELALLVDSYEELSENEPSTLLGGALFENPDDYETRTSSALDPLIPLILEDMLDADNTIATKAKRGSQLMPTSASRGVRHISKLTQAKGAITPVGFASLVTCASDDGDLQPVTKPSFSPARNNSAKAPSVLFATMEREQFMENEDVAFETTEEFSNLGPRTRLSLNNLHTRSRSSSNPEDFFSAKSDDDTVNDDTEHETNESGPDGSGEDTVFDSIIGRKRITSTSSDVASRMSRFDSSQSGNANTVMETTTADDADDSDSVLTTSTITTANSKSVRRKGTSKTSKKSKVSSGLDDAKAAATNVVGKVLLGYTATTNDVQQVSRWLVLKDSSFVAGKAFTGLRQALRMMRRYVCSPDEEANDREIESLRRSLQHVSDSLERYTGFPLNSPEFMKLLRSPRGLRSVIESLQREYNSALGAVRETNLPSESTTDGAPPNVAATSISPPTISSSMLSSSQSVPVPKPLPLGNPDNLVKAYPPPMTRSRIELDGPSGHIRRRSATIDMLLLLSKLGLRRDRNNDISDDAYRQLAQLLEGGNREKAALESIDQTSLIELLGYLDSFTPNGKNGNEGKDSRIERLEQVCEARLVLMVEENTAAMICDQLLAQPRVRGPVRRIATYALHFLGAVIGSRLARKRRAKQRGRNKMKSVEEEKDISSSSKTLATRASAATPHHRKDSSDGKRPRKIISPIIDDSAANSFPSTLSPYSRESDFEDSDDMTVLKPGDEESDMETDGAESEEQAQQGSMERDCSPPNPPLALMYAGIQTDQDYDKEAHEFKRASAIAAAAAAVARSPSQRARRMRSWVTCDESADQQVRIMEHKQGFEAKVKQRQKVTPLPRPKVTSMKLPRNLSKLLEDARAFDTEGEKYAERFFRRDRRRGDDHSRQLAKAEKISLQDLNNRDENDLFHQRSLDRVVGRERNWSTYEPRLSRRPTSSSVASAETDYSMSTGSGTINPVHAVQGLLKHLSRVVFASSGARFSNDATYLQSRLRLLQQHAASLRDLHPIICVADSESRPGLCRLPKASEVLESEILQHPKGYGANQTPYVFDFEIGVLAFFKPCDHDTALQLPDDTSAGYRKILRTVFELLPSDFGGELGLHDLSETATLSQHASAGFALTTVLHYIDKMTQNQTSYLSVHRLGDEREGTTGTVAGGYLHCSGTGADAKFIFTEESGHYGARWTKPGIRHEFSNFMRRSGLGDRFVLKPFFRENGLRAPSVMDMFEVQSSCVQHTTTPHPNPNLVESPEKPLEDNDEWDFGSDDSQD